MANDKDSTKLYKVRNGYAVTQGNKVVKEGNVVLTNKEHALQSWKVEEVIAEVSTPCDKEENSSSEVISSKEENSNLDRSVKKSRTFNRVMKTSKE